MEAQPSVTIKYTKQQWMLLITLCIVTFLGAMIYSIQSPFYPAEAESKMATPSEYGFVLGTFGLTQFLLGPLYGTYLLKIGVKNAFHGGIVVAAVSTMIFGFLNSIENGYIFVTLSFLLRILEACGALAMSVATYTFVATDFPGSIGRTFATVETVYGFGMSIGPSVGVMLFNIGGFTLPFVALGFINFLVGGLTYIVLQKLKDLKVQVPSIKEQNENNKKTFGFITLLKVPPITMYACSIISAILTSQFILGSILEPNLRQFNLSSTMFSVMFLLQGLTQAIFSIIWGFICDRISKPEFITLLGSALLTISSFLIGPFVYIPIEPNLAMTAGCLIGIGLGSSSILVSSFLQGLREATACQYVQEKIMSSLGATHMSEVSLVRIVIIYGLTTMLLWQLSWARVNGLKVASNYGFPVNESTSGMVSGLLMSSISFGCFSGPLIAGILYQHYGFRVATTILSFLNLIMTLTLGIFAFTKKATGPPNQKAQVDKNEF